MTRVWLALAALTMVEVALTAVALPPLAMLALLIGLSLWKAAMIAWWFMHLKSFRPRMVTLLIPMMFLCVGAMLALLPDAAARALSLETK